MTYSFDIFDTCLVRKCGTPQNMLDVLSLRVFKKTVDEWVRQEFVVSRRAAEDGLWNENQFAKLSDIYASMDFRNEALLPLQELVQVEMELEKELLVPVLKMRDRIDALREKGNHITYLSDMYLPDALIRGKMEEYGFLKSGDTLYVSNEVGHQKGDGSLYEYVQEKESLHKCKWVHCGDNRHSDYDVPRKMGIRSKIVTWKYNPYPNRWISSDYSVGFKYKSIIAGLSRALSLSNPDIAHRDFVLDIIAPFYVSWVWRIFERACRDGVERLYFCARDAYHIHKIALALHPWFPQIKQIEYLYISRDALYNEDNAEYKIAYFESVGLASKDEIAAIVDTTSSGKTLSYLNDFLCKHGYNSVMGYYYLLGNKVSGLDENNFVNEVYDVYVRMNPKAIPVQSAEHFYVLENFFAMNVDGKTIDYNGLGPVFSMDVGCEELVLDDIRELPDIQQTLLELYAKSFANMGLGTFSQCCFENLAIPTLSSFFYRPVKYYLGLMRKIKMTDWNGKIQPFIRKKSFFSLYILKKHDYVWKSGTVALSVPDFLLNIVRKIKVNTY